MSNILLGFPDRTLVSASYTPTFPAFGSWGGTFPITNLQNNQLGIKARSTNVLAASTKFKIDLGVARAVRISAILRHNFSSAATIRFRGYSDSGYSAQVCDSATVSIWPEGFPLAENKKRYQEDFYYIWSATQTARYWLVEITDTANGAGYVEIGRCLLMPAISTAVNISYGTELAIETDTQSSRSLGGVDFFDVKQPRRAQPFEFEALSLTEAMTFFDMSWDLGIDREFLFCFDPTDTGILLKRRTFLARLRKPSTIKYPYIDNYSAAFEAVEVL